jgi:hypothetical protein
MSNFTHISPANVTGLLSTKTPALISIYNTIAARVAPDFTPMAFTVKHKKLQIVEAIDETLRNAGTTYEAVEASLQAPTTEQNLALPQGYPTPTDQRYCINSISLRLMPAQ